MIVENIQEDDLFAVSKTTDIALQRLAPYSAGNPLPYSIVSRDVLPMREGHVFWPDRPTFWETFSIPSGALPTQVDDTGWTIEGLFRHWIEPLIYSEHSLGQMRDCHPLATTLVFAEIVIEAFERHMQTEGYLLRWLPIHQQYEIPVIHQSVENRRLFTIEPFFSKLNTRVMLDQMKLIRDHHCSEISMKFKKGSLPPVSKSCRFLEPEFGPQVYAFPLNADEGLIISSVYSSTPRF